MVTKKEVNFICRKGVKGIDNLQSEGGKKIVRKVIKVLDFLIWNIDMRFYRRCNFKYETAFLYQ